MKKRLLFIALFASLSSLFAQNLYNEDGIRLYHTPSQEEIEWAKRKGIVVETTPTAPPPSGQIRPIAEFEPAEAVLVRYPFGIPISLIKEMANDVKVITIVANTSQQNTVLNQYNSNGVNTANCQFLIANTDTHWTRDYGPWFMALDNSSVAMFDFTYNRPRPNDNQINGRLATYLSDNGVEINRYASTLTLTGGNFMNDGIYYVNNMFVSDCQSYFNHEHAHSFEIAEDREKSGWHGKWSGAVRPVFINNDYHLIETFRK